jgi:hypothetical protein
VALYGLSNAEFNELTGRITSDLVNERHEVLLDTGGFKNIKPANLKVI